MVRLLPNIKLGNSVVVIAGEADLEGPEDGGTGNLDDTLEKTGVDRRSAVQNLADRYGICLERSFGKSILELERDEGISLRRGEQGHPVVLLAVELFTGAKEEAVFPRSADALSVTAGISAGGESGRETSSCARAATLAGFS